MWNTGIAAKLKELPLSFFLNDGVSGGLHAVDYLRVQLVRDRHTLGASGHSDPGGRLSIRRISIFPLAFQSRFHPLNRGKTFSSNLQCSARSAPPSNGG